LTLETLPIDEYKKVCDLFDDEVYDAINLEKCVNDRLVVGGPSAGSVREQINSAIDIIG
jgi:argininosuccinate lyase